MLSSLFSLSCPCLIYVLFWSCYFVCQSSVDIVLLTVKEIGLFGSNKISKLWQAVSWVGAFSKKRFGETSCMDRIMFLCNTAALLIIDARSSEEMMRTS